MKFRLLILLICVLFSFALTIPAFAGGWATITLEELPSGLVAGEQVTLRFAVRQHGVTLMTGLEPVIQARNTQTGEKFTVYALPAENQTGVYEAVFTFPSAGSWEWTIQAFTMNQRMPEISVADASVNASQTPATSPSPMLVAGITGLALAALAGAFTLRPPRRWALALVVLGLLVGGVGFAMAAANPESDMGSKSNLSPATDEQADQAFGEALFIAKGCVVCHRHGDVDRQYYDIHVDFGRDLTNFNADPDYLRMWLKDPSAVKSDAEMPQLELDEAEIEALIAFINEPSGHINQ
jgi:cytochrome c2